MLTIYKYELKNVGPTEILMHKGAVILSAQNQGGRLMVWAQANKGDVMEARKFFIAVTGGTVPYSNLKFIDTVQLDAFVVHVFEDLS